MSRPSLRATATRTAVTSALALGVLAVGGVTSAALAADAPQPVEVEAAPASPTASTPATTPEPVPVDVVPAPVPATDGTSGTVHVDAGGGSTGDDTVWLVLGGTGALLAVAGAGLGLTRRRA